MWFRCTQMSLHVLRHVADDVFRLQRPADEFSCFWGENSLKKLKNLNTTRKEPLRNITKALRVTGATFDQVTSAKFIPRFLHRLPISSQNGLDRSIVGFRGVQTPHFRLVGSNQINQPEGLICTGEIRDIGERPLLRSQNDDDENAYFYAKGLIHKTIRVWKTIRKECDSAKEEYTWTGEEEDVIVEAQRFATLSEAYHINHGDDIVNSDVVGIYYFSGLQTDYIAKIKLSEIECKVVVHLIDGKRYAYKFL